jgi:YVTN family beta-propeller protein
VPETSYAPCGDLSLAYQVFGDGPVELVTGGALVSHVELFWTVPDPELHAFYDQLATFCRIVIYDKAGVGLSDPIPKVRTLDDRAAEIEAVMDAAGFGKAVVWGASDAGPPAMMFAATRPEQTQALILTGTFPYWPVTAPGSGSPYVLSVAISPDGKRTYAVVNPDLFNFNSQAVSVSVLDTDPASATYNTQIATITVPAGAQDIAVSPDGTRAYVTESDGKTVTVIDTATNTVLGSFTTDQTGGGYTVRSIAVGPDGTVYVTDSADGKIYASTLNTSM